MIAIMATVVMISLGAVRIFQIEKNDQANKHISGPCIDKGRTVVVGQKHLLSLTTFTCEEN
ncbi:MAG TPA: hypothetical protein VIG80_15615 [Bacillaceae bacterium]